MSLSMWDSGVLQAMFSEGNLPGDAEFWRFNKIHEYGAYGEVISLQSLTAISYDAPLVGRCCRGRLEERADRTCQICHCRPPASAPHVTTFQPRAQRGLTREERARAAASDILAGSQVEARRPFDRVGFCCTTRG